MPGEAKEGLVQAGVSRSVARGRAGQTGAMRTGSLPWKDLESLTVICGRPEEARPAVGSGPGLHAQEGVGVRASGRHTWT